MRRNPTVPGTMRAGRGHFLCGAQARSVEAEVLRLKTMGLSFEEIAEQIRASRTGQKPSVGDPARSNLPGRLCNQPTGLSQGFQEGDRATPGIGSRGAA